ncbi:MAG: PAS domain S-box protein [Nanoarchaeota archaeon]|nr:PAS domain S-box protein [Nanoarchaeota archaeon]
MRETLKLIMSLGEASDSFVILVNLSNKIIWANRYADWVGKKHGVKTLKGRDASLLFTEYYDSGSVSRAFKSKKIIKKDLQDGKKLVLTPILKNSRVYGILVICKDDSSGKSRKIETKEKRMAEEKLTKINEFFALAQESSNSGSWDWDIIRNRFYWSPQFLKLFGMPKNTVAGFKAWTKSLHPEDADMALKRIKDAIRTKTDLDSEYRIILPNKEIRWIHSIGRTKYSGSKPVRMTGLCIDITEAKKTEELIAASESKYKSLFSNMLSGFALHKIILDKKGRPVDYEFIEVNPKFEQMTGLKRKEILGKRVTAVLPGIRNDPIGWINKYGEVALKRKGIEIENYAKSLKRWYKISAYSPSPGFFATLFDDITDRKNIAITLEKKESLLEKQNQFLSQLSKSTNTIGKDFLVVYKKIVKEITDIMEVELSSIWLFDEKNTKLLEEVRYEKSKQTYSYGDQLKVEDYPVYFDALRKQRVIVSNDVLHDDIVREFGKGYFKKFGITSLLDSGIKIGNETIGVLCIEHIGKPRIWSSEEQNFITTVTDFLSSIIEANVVMQDEIKLKESEQKYKLIVDNLKDALYVHDFKGNILDVNDNACKMLGYKREELVGSNLKKIDSEANIKLIKQRMTHLITEGSLLFNGEHIRKDGSHVFVDVSAVVISKEGEGLVQSFVRDITEKKKTEEERERLIRTTQEKVEELERFQSLTINRELKMIELKKRIAELEEKNERSS